MKKWKICMITLLLLIAIGVVMTQNDPQIGNKCVASACSCDQHGRMTCDCNDVNEVNIDASIFFSQVYFEESRKFNDGNYMSKSKISFEVCEVKILL